MMHLIVIDQRVMKVIIIFHTLLHNQNQISISYHLIITLAFKQWYYIQLEIIMHFHVLSQVICEKYDNGKMNKNTPI